MKRYVLKKKGLLGMVTVLDWIGTILGAPFWFLRNRPSDPLKIKRILVIRLDHLGDVVMTRPALYALWQKFPAAQLDLMLSGDNLVLFDDEKFIRNVIPITSHWFSRSAKTSSQIKTFFKLWNFIRKNHYDLVIDFRGDLRHILAMALAGVRYRLGYGITGGGFLLTHPVPYHSEKHQVVLNAEVLKPLGIDSAVVNPPFSYSGERKRRFWNLLGETLRPGTPLVVIHPGAGYPSKRWGNARYRELILKIIESGKYQVALIGSDAEREEWPEPLCQHPLLHDWRGKTHLSDLPVLFENTRLFIGNDSGPSHIAAAQGTELVILFSGTNDYRKWHPWSKRLHLIHHNVPCSPCEAKVCPLKHHDCMNKIEVSQVFKTVSAILNDKPVAGETTHEF